MYLDCEIKLISCVSKKKTFYKSECEIISNNNHLKKTRFLTNDSTLIL